MPYLPGALFSSMEETRAYLKNQRSTPLSLIAIHIESYPRRLGMILDPVSILDALSILLELHRLKPHVYRPCTSWYRNSSVVRCLASSYCPCAANPALTDANA